MSEAMLTIGLAVLGFLIPFASFQIYQTWKYRDHRNESVREEVRDWGLLILVWSIPVLLLWIA